MGRLRLAEGRGDDGVALLERAVTLAEATRGSDDAQAARARVLLAEAR